MPHPLPSKPASRGTARIGKPRSYLTPERRAALVREYGWAPDEVEWWLDRGDASEAWLAERREYLGRDGL